MVVMSSSGGGVPMGHHGGGASNAAGAAGGGGGAAGMGGVGAQDKMPSLFIDRPKMPRATWDALRAHILRERQKKKHEQEQTEEVRQITVPV